MEIKMKKITTKELCIVSMLLAITVVLSYLSGYLRIGNAIKFSVSFISVYLAAALFGPFMGGLVGALADVISCFVNPVGALIWQLTAIEFCYGASFGFFFRNKCNKERKAWDIIIRASLCSFFQFIVNIFVKTSVLKDLGYVPGDFLSAVYIRLPGCIVMFLIMIPALFIAEYYYVRKFRNMAKSDR